MWPGHGIFNLTARKHFKQIHCWANTLSGWIIGFNVVVLVRMPGIVGMLEMYMFVCL